MWRSCGFQAMRGAGSLFMCAANGFAPVRDAHQRHVADIEVRLSDTYSLFYNCEGAWRYRHVVHQLGALRLLCS